MVHLLAFAEALEAMEFHRQLLAVRFSLTRKMLLVGSFCVHNLSVFVLNLSTFLDRLCTAILQIKLGTSSIIALVVLTYILKTRSKVSRNFFLLSLSTFSFKGDG